MYKNDTEHKIQEGLNFLNNNPQKALELFNDILKINSTKIEALNGKGSALIKLNNYDEAELIFRESLKIKETSSAYLNMGIISKNKEEYNEALRYYNQALEMNYNLLNIVNILNNEVKEAMDIQKRQSILNRYHESVRSLIVEGINYQKAERFWDALDCYELAIKEEPLCKNIVMEYIEEIKIIIQKEFLLKRPSLDDTPINKLKIQSIKELIIENNQTYALININKVLENNPNDLEALNIKGTILFYFEDFEGSLYCFDKCIHLDSNYVYAIFNKGIVLRRMKKLSEAIKCFEQIRNISYFPIYLEVYQEEILEKLSYLLDISIDG